MSSSKQKKVHYERGTKGGKSSHAHRSSRDSGVGSSSASDRASLGTSPQDDASLNHQQIEDQRQILRVVQEALDAANEKIKHLEASNTSLNGSLAESNRENRLLKREKMDLLTQVEYLTQDLYDEKRLNSQRRPPSPRTRIAAAPASASSREDRPSSSSSRGEAASRQQYYRREEERQQGRPGERWRDLPVPLYTDSRPPPPTVPQAPYNPTPNPFMPAGRPSSVTYTTAPITYSPAPVFALPSNLAANSFPNDGMYHPYPLDRR